MQSGLLMEREQVFEVLGDMLDECRQGELRIATVSGPPGTGKTALVRELVRSVEDTGGVAITSVGSVVDAQAEIGVIGQLLRADSICARHARRVDELLSSAGNVSPSRLLGNALLLFSDIAMNLTRRFSMVVIVVDDADLADKDSLWCLEMAAERLWRYPVAMIFTDVVGDGQALPGFSFAMLSSPREVRVCCHPLSERAVEDFLTINLDETVDHHFARAWHSISGGNPLLLHAMLDSHQADAVEDGADCAIGPVFSAAVLRCLRRTGPLAQELALALVVLGENSPVQVVAQVLQTEIGTLRRTIRLLEECGLLVDARFRHRAIRSVVKSNSTTTQRQRIHHRAATVLRDVGAPSIQVAEHLVKAFSNEVDETFPRDGWEVQILLEVASEYRSQYLIDNARRHLTTAFRLTSDARSRASILASQVAWERELSLDGVTGNLGELVDAVHQGYLSARQSRPIVKELLLRGRESKALQVLAYLADLTLPEDLISIVRWIAVNMPGALTRSTDIVPEPPTASSLGPAFGDTHDYEDLAVTVLHGVLSRSLDEDEVLLATEYVMRGCHMSPQSPEVVEMAIQSLLYLDRAPVASLWCDRLLEDSATREHPLLGVRLAGLRAEAARRQGFIEQAVNLARGELNGRPRSRSPHLNEPGLAAEIMVLVTRGDLADAERLVRSAVPQTAPYARGELHYLHARGLVLRATGQLAAALGDFRACGELMRRWRMDLPALVPWRLELARTYLALGNSDKARDAVEEELELLPPGRSRTRGMALRTLAAAREPRERLSLLRESIDHLLAAGDHLEAAGALAELSVVHRDRGQLERARRMARQADEERKRCGEVTVTRVPTPPPAKVPRPTKASGHRSGSADPGEALTEAEHRVAVLAARGATNREIAQQLFITPSTVEQHLTRVYRKLSVRRRGQLSQRIDISGQPNQPVAAP